MKRIHDFLRKNTVSVAGIAMISTALLLLASVGGFLWMYTINFWTHFFGMNINIVWWQGALLGVCPFVGQASIPAAILTFVLSFIL